MKREGAAFFHKLYGVQKPRVTYYGRDFFDYLAMIAVTAAIVVLVYGTTHLLTYAGLALCAFALLMFPVRHGFEFRVPLFLRRPQDVLYMLVYKLQNVPVWFPIALAVLALENVAIAATPRWPHSTSLMTKVALVLFYGHLGVITIYRTVILAGHLAQKEKIREVLMQTPWKRVINEKTNMTLEILHAYATGLLTHIVLLAPWFLVIRFAKFSVLFLPVILVINFIVHRQWVRAYNAWFYRDHWVGHNSELEFLLLHGSHHDAIPSGLIAVSGNGFLEGFFRYTTGSPVALYSPILTFLALTLEVKTDIDLHQYIPGVFPKIPKPMMEVYQHSTHHYGRLEPYSQAAKLDRPGVSEGLKRRLRWMPREMSNSFELDEQLGGLEWDNPTHVSTLSLYDKYQ